MVIFVKGKEPPIITLKVLIISFVYVVVVGEIMRGDDDLSSHEAEEVRPPPSAREGFFFIIYLLNSSDVIHQLKVVFLLNERFYDMVSYAKKI